MKIILNSWGGVGFKDTLSDGNLGSTLKNFAYKIIFYRRHLKIVLYIYDRSSYVNMESFYKGKSDLNLSSKCLNMGEF